MSDTRSVVRGKSPASYHDRYSLGATDAWESVGGFTLAELLIVVAVIAIVAAIALPVMSRAKAAAMESQATGLLRAINGGQAAFAASCASGFYAPSLLWLTRPPTTGGDGYVSPDLNLNTINRGGYQIRFSQGLRGGSPLTCNGLRAGRAVTTYFIGANPLSLDGSRYLGTNQSGTIYQSTIRIRVTLQGPPPLPAVPLQ